MFDAKFTAVREPLSYMVLAAVAKKTYNVASPIGERSPHEGGTDMHVLRACFAVVTLILVADRGIAAEDIEFVAEHLAEVPMDNRYATLPIWSEPQDGEIRRTHVETQGAFNKVSSGHLDVSGPMFSIGLKRQLNARWSVGALVFHDPMSVRSAHEHRPLQTLFAPDTPIDRPVDAHFSNLDGSITDSGAGFFIGRERHGDRLADYGWIAGVLWQRVKLEQFRLEYEVAGGSSIGTIGTIDFDDTYAHIVPFVGIELPRERGSWFWNAHALYAMPLPRRGMAGHITGPGFDIRGNTDDAGAGKHFGDPSLTLGFTFTYRPWHVSADVGALVSQALVEPWAHRGIERNYVLSVSWLW
jgi:hypothetical protein